MDGEIARGAKDGRARMSGHRVLGVDGMGVVEVADFLDCSPIDTESLGSNGRRKQRTRGKKKRKTPKTRLITCGGRVTKVDSLPYGTSSRSEDVEWQSS
jgi:hypothetical protein